MSAKLPTNFVRDGDHTVVIGTDQNVKLHRSNCPCRVTIQCSMAS